MEYLVMCRITGSGLSQLILWSFYEALSPRRSLVIIIGGQLDKVDPHDYLGQDSMPTTSKPAVCVRVPGVMLF